MIQIKIILCLLEFIRVQSCSYKGLLYFIHLYVTVLNIPYGRVFLTQKSKIPGLVIF